MELWTYAKMAKPLFINKKTRGERVFFIGFIQVTPHKYQLIGRVK